MIYNFNKKDLKVQTHFNPSLARVAKQWNLHRNRFYQMLRDYGILDENNQPMPDYQDYFIPYYNKGYEYAGKYGHYVTQEGQEMILERLKEEDFAAITIKNSLSVKHGKTINQPRTEHNLILQSNFEWLDF